MMKERDYSKIIDKPHHYSFNHRPMDRLSRAAQFAPFAALQGYEEAIIEEGRFVNSNIDISDEEKEIISYKLKYIVDNKIKDEIKITYFVHDATKDGGSIKEIFSSIRKIDEVEKIIILDTKIKIDIDDILNVEGDALNIFNDI